MTRAAGHWADENAPTIYDFNPEDVCPTCFTVCAANGKCICDFE